MSKVRHFDEDDDSNEYLGFICCILGVVLFVGIAAVLIMIKAASSDVNHKPPVYYTQTYVSASPVKYLSPGIMEAILNQTAMEARVIDFTSTGRERVLDLLVLVHSHPDSSTHKRNAIRESWKKDIPHRVEVVFVVPAHNIPVSTLDVLRMESMRYRDMVVFLDAPLIPESESLLLELAWCLQRKNIKFEYLLKTRDSVYVRLHELMNELLQKLSNSESNSYLGYFQGKQSSRDKTHKKHHEHGWFLCEKYIRFAHSGGYILSSKLIQRLYSQATYLYPYNNEDVALGTWLSPFKDVDWHHDIRFDTDLGHSRGCRNNWLVFQSENFSMQHKLLQNTGKVCLSEREQEKTYNYNFSVYPSKCCTPVSFS